MMASSDPSICMVHPGKRHAIGVCHLCLRDRLMRLSLSGESSSSHNTLLPSCSSRSSFDSSCSKTDESSGVYNSNHKSSGKLGTIFSLIESDSEEPPRESDESLPEILQKSRSVKPPGKPNHESAHSPLISAPPTPPPALQQDQSKPKSSNLSWISSLFRLRKRKKKSAHGGPVETNFFPPEAWNDDFQARSSLPDRDRLWRSRSVSSGRVIKKSFTPLEHQEENHHHHQHSGIGSGFDSAQGRFSVSGFEHGPRKAGVEPGIGRFSVSGAGLEHAPGKPSAGNGLEPATAPRVSSLIALDMRDATSKVAAYDVAGPRGSVASLMDVDRKCAGADVAHASSSPSPGGNSFLQRSKSTGGWGRKIRSESPSSVLMPNPTAAGAGGEWSFYLTPLRTFSRNRSRHAR